MLVAVVLIALSQAPDCGVLRHRAAESFFELDAQLALAKCLATRGELRRSVAVLLQAQQQHDRRRFVAAFRLQFPPSPRTDLSDPFGKHRQRPPPDALIRDYLEAPDRFGPWLSDALAAERTAALVLPAALDDPDPFMAIALHTAAVDRMPMADYLRELESDLFADELLVRESALGALLHWRRSEVFAKQVELEPVMARLEKDGDAHQRSMTLALASAQSRLDATPLLQQALRSENAGFRYRAFRLLAEEPGSYVTDLLREYYWREQDPDLHAQLVATLCQRPYHGVHPTERPDACSRRASALRRAWKRTQGAASPAVEQRVREQCERDEGFACDVSVCLEAVRTAGQLNRCLDAVEP